MLSIQLLFVCWCHLGLSVLPTAALSVLQVEQMISAAINRNNAVNLKETFELKSEVQALRLNNVALSEKLSAVQKSHVNVDALDAVAREMADSLRRLTALFSAQYQIRRRFRRSPTSYKNQHATSGNIQSSTKATLVGVISNMDMSKELAEEISTHSNRIDNPPKHSRKIRHFKQKFKPDRQNDQHFKQTNAANMLHYDNVVANIQILFRQQTNLQTQFDIFRQSQVHFEQRMQQNIFRLSAKMDDLDQKVNSKQSESGHGGPSASLYSSETVFNGSGEEGDLQLLTVSGNSVLLSGTNLPSGLTLDVSDMINNQEQVRNKLKQIRTEFQKRAESVDSKLAMKVDKDSARKLEESIFEQNQILQAVQGQLLSQKSQLHRVKDHLDSKIAGIDQSTKDAIRKVYDWQHLASAIKRSQQTQFSRIQDFAQNLHTFETNLLKYALKLTTLQADFLNASLTIFKKSDRDTRQDLAVEQMTTKIKWLEEKYEGGEMQIKSIKEDIANRATVQKLKNVQNDVEKMYGYMQRQRKYSREISQNYSLIRNSVNRLDSTLPHDCSTVTNATRSSPNIYLIRPRSAQRSFHVFCSAGSNNSSSPLWTVIQRRTLGNVDFNRTWIHYKKGFGNLRGDFYLGNEKIHWLTVGIPDARNCLRITMKDIFGKIYINMYSVFAVGSEAEDFILLVGGYHGNATDAMAYHNQMRFSTFDKDNDASSTHCARYYLSGWWFSHCQKANPNGNYEIGMIWFHKDEQRWIQLQEITMDISPYGC